MFVIENENLGLRQYTHADDHDMYLCWQDIDTQKGYNGIFDQSFDSFKMHDISRFKFWVVVVDKNTNQNVGVLRLGLSETCPDLAIWIYPQYRNRGYGVQSFRLALTYIFEKFAYAEIAAGCYQDNRYSLKMLDKVGFTRNPDGDEKEVNCFTGEETVQFSFRIDPEKLAKSNVM